MLAFSQTFFKGYSLLIDCALGLKCNASISTPSGTRWSSCSIRAPLLIVRPSILNVITLSIVSRSPKTKWSYRYHLCLEPILFFSFFFSKVRSLITIITCLPTSPRTLSCFTTWIGPSYLVTHLDERMSPTRFHQLSKTKLGLSII